MKNQFQFTSLVAAAVTAALTAGCASDRNTALHHADHVYAEAAADKALMSNAKAAAYMDAADNHLHQADHAAISQFGDNSNARDVDSLAYIGEQEVLTAKAVAARDAAAAEVAKLTAERDAARLAKNERDAAAEKARLAAAQQERDRADAALSAALDKAKAGGAEIKQTGDEIKVTFRNLTFDTNKANIKPEFKATLDELANALQQRYPQAKLEVRGYTDSRGADTFNAKLSEKRAVAVKTFLIGKGITAERVAHKGLGETNPVATNETEQGRAMNRRVELSVLGTQDK